MGGIGLAGGVGGGGGLHFRDPADEFTGADLAACRTARDTYFLNAANASALSQFASDRSLAIILNPADSTDNVFETYLGSASSYQSAQWVSRTDAIQGNKGNKGDKGDAGGLTAEQVRDTVAAFLRQGTDVTITHDDDANTLTISASGGLTSEGVRDAVAAFLRQGTNITLTHDDDGNTLTIATSGISMSDADARYLRLAGGTLTGKLTLDGDPTSALHASTKSYVDSAINALRGGVSSAFDTLQELAAGLAARLRLSGGTLTGPLTLSGAPTQDLHAATKAYVDSRVGTTPQTGSHNRLIGWSAGAVPTRAEIAAATAVDDTNLLTVPVRTAGQDAHIFFGVPADPGLPDMLYFSNNPTLDQAPFFSERTEANAGDFTRSAVAYQIMSTDNALFASIYGTGSITLRLSYT